MGAATSRGGNYRECGVVSGDQVRGPALALPGVVEQDHHGRPSFRVAGRIFATLWDQQHLNVMLGEAGIRTVVEAWPGVCQEFWWGKRLGAAHVDLALADELLVGELLADAWEQKAPKRLLQDRIADAADTRTAPSARRLALARTFRLGQDDLRAWERAGLSEAAFDDWLTDRVARGPAGRRARDTYGADDVHDFARRAILAALQLRAGDRLLDVGCGGGLLLRDARANGASATGIDHSEEMVDLARERAPDAEVALASAEHLPFPDGSFTAVAMSVVFFSLPRPLAALHEARRVLKPAGRIAIYTTSAKLRGTPAAPEPLASRSHFYEDDELVALADSAGFADSDDVGSVVFSRRRSMLGARGAGPSRPGRATC
jgi:SAM-dependent methyltransferase